MTTANKNTEALNTTKTACKYMLNMVTKQFEDFEAEIDTMNDGFSADSDRDALAATNSQERNQTKNMDNMDNSIVHYEDNQRKLKVVNYDSEDDSTEEETKNLSLIHI